MLAPAGDRARGAGRATRSPDTSWAPWTAPLALIGGLVLAAVAGLVVDLPAVALGGDLTSSHTPPGIAIADTFVQDVAFVLAPSTARSSAGASVRSWQFGLRRPGDGWRYATRLIVRAAGRVHRAQRRVVGTAEPDEGEAAGTARHQRRRLAARC